MIALPHSSWQQRRSEFNHQWLKNRLLSALDSAANFLDGRLEGEAFIENVVVPEVEAWPGRMVELMSLLDSFDIEMSPRVLFEEPPLGDWEADLKAVMSDLVGHEWRRRYPVSEWMGDARSAGGWVNNQYIRLAALIASGRYQDPEFAACLNDFRTACRSLARSLERFPDRILVL